MIQILCALGSELTSEKSKAVRNYRLLGIGKGLKRFSTPAIELVDTLGLTEEVKPSWSLIAQEVLYVMKK